MFRGLRLRLTLLYLLVALAFTALMMLGTHQLVARYFQATTDLALRYRMAQEFTLLGIPLPSELNLAVEMWSQRRASPPPTQILHQPVELEDEGEEHESETNEHEQLAEAGLDEQGEEAYDGELASIYTLPLDDLGQLQAVSLSSAPALQISRGNPCGSETTFPDIRRPKSGNPLFHFGIRGFGISP